MFIYGNDEQCIELFQHPTSHTLDLRIISPRGHLMATVNLDPDQVLQLLAALQRIRQPDPFF